MSEIVSVILGVFAVPSRWLRLRRELRTVKRAYLRAADVEECLVAFCLVSEECADRLAYQLGIQPGYTPYVTANKLIAARFPSSWVARNVLDEERQYRELTAKLNLMTAVRV